MRVATLLFLIEDGKILLANKKRGYGVGLWNGVGGKVNQFESIEEAVKRECYEEISVEPKKIQKRAFIEFKGESESDDFEVHVYTSTKWVGNPKESEEMNPKWFKIESIPYSKMWSDDSYWLPHLINGKNFNAKFKLNSKNEIISHEINFSN